MKKLKLKHLAPYLPYEVTFEFEVGKVYGDSKIPFEMRNQTLRSGNIDLCINHGKLHLRPLSQLTKEIEHNGERFVPMDYLKNFDGEYFVEIEYDNTVFLKDACDLNLFEISRTDIGVINKLYEWHFDVFGLIEKGLALEKQ